MKQRFVPLVVLTAVFGILAAWQFIAIKRKLAGTITVSGVVVSRSNVSNRQKQFVLEVDFRDRSAEKHRFQTLASGVGGRQLQPGAAVDVIYSPVDPQGSARLGGIFRVWLWPLIFLAGFVSCAITAVKMHLVRRDSGSSPRSEKEPMPR